MKKKKYIYIYIYIDGFSSSWKEKKNNKNFEEYELQCLGYYNFSGEKKSVEENFWDLQYLKQEKKFK